MRLIDIVDKLNLYKSAEWLYSVIPYYFGRVYAFPPKSLVLYLSYRCDLRCKHCKYYCKSRVDRTLQDIKTHKELEFREILDILRQSKKLNSKNIENKN